MALPGVLKAYYPCPTPQLFLQVTDTLLEHSLQITWSDIDAVIQTVVECTVDVKTKQILCEMTGLFRVHGYILTIALMTRSQAFVVWIYPSFCFY